MIAKIPPASFDYETANEHADKPVFRRHEYEVAELVTQDGTEVGLTGTILTGVGGSSKIVILRRVVGRINSTYMTPVPEEKTEKLIPCKECKGRRVIRHPHGDRPCTKCAAVGNNRRARRAAK